VEGSRVADHKVPTKVLDKTNYGVDSDAPGEANVEWTEVIRCAKHEQASTTTHQQQVPHTLHSNWGPGFGGAGIRQERNAKPMPRPHTHATKEEKW
jgi:hypothetical protein